MLKLMPILPNIRYRIPDFRKKISDFRLPTSDIRSGFTLIELLVACHPKFCIAERRKAIQGFTLIELLIVITILGILASLTLASFGGAQAKARDGVRKNDLAQIKRALELAKADCQGNAYYPGTSGPGGSPLGAINDYKDFLAPHLSSPSLKYISSVLTDPQNSGNQRYGYALGGSTLATACPNSAGTPNSQNGYPDFLLAVQLERTADSDAASSATRCAGNGIIQGFGYSGIGWYFACNN